MAFFSKKKKQSILTVLAVMLIAQFGVFSSVTVNAYRPVVGAIFFLLLHVAAVIYIVTTHKEPKRGLIQLGIVSASAFITSLLFYYAWEARTVPLARLFPEKFFTESTMVAAVMGVASSVVLSGKE